MRIPEVREAQAKMAKEYGIEGFCYWHYWFGNGKQLLERPFKEVLESGKPDFGFCYASFRWANGHSLSSILKGTDMTVGDFVRSIKQLIDLLTQIGGAAEELRPACREGIKRLDRGVISYMLGDL